MIRPSEQQSTSPPVIFFPGRFRQPVEEKVVFSGDLTAYFHEQVEKLKVGGSQACLDDGIWEIPQLVGFDNNRRVVALISRLTGEDLAGESEFLVSSLNQQWIIHINLYDDEDDFFDACFELIQANFINISWESFLYDTNGTYQGRMIVEEMDRQPLEEPVAVLREIYEP